VDEQASVGWFVARRLGQAVIRYPGLALCAVTCSAAVLRWGIPGLSVLLAVVVGFVIVWTMGDSELFARVISLRSASKRNLDSFSRKIENQLKPLGVKPRDFQVVEFRAGYDVEIRGNRKSILSAADSIAEQVEAISWNQRPTEHLGITTLRIRMFDVLSAPVGEFSKDSFDESRGVRFAVDEDGNDVWLDESVVSLLLAGTPGSGKSAISAFVGLGAAREQKVLAIDCKAGLEFAPFRFSPTVDVVHVMTEVVAGLQEVVLEMETRFVLLETYGMRKVPEGDENWEPIWVVVDELQALFEPADKSLRSAADEARLLLQDLVARGRAAGVVVIVATQHANAALMSSAFRDLLRVRIGFHQSTSAAWKMVLGEFDGHVSDVPHGCPGLALMRVDKSNVVRLRTYEMSDASLEELAT